MQVLANKKMADYEQELGLKMWKDTNYPAQVEMMKEAGLNEIILYSNLKKAYEANSNKIWMAYSTFTKEIANTGNYEFAGIKIEKVEIQ